MKRLILFVLMFAVSFSQFALASANQKGETAHPVQKRTFTFE